MNQDFSNSIRHPEAPEGVSIHAGFPNPGGEAHGLALNLQQLLIKHPVSTFLFRVAGDAWQEMGIFAGDIAIIDKSIEPRPSDLICWWHYSHTDFVIGYRRRLPENGQVWGTVTSVIHQIRA